MSDIVYCNSMSDATARRLFGCAVPADKKFKPYAFPMKAGGEAFTFPETLSYEHEIGPIHNQAYGTCFCEAATTMIEKLLWEYTGIKYAFTVNEIYDIAADSKGSSYEQRKKSTDAACSGGFPGPALEAAYNFNDNLKLHYFTDQKESAICKLFKQIIDERIGGFKIKIVNCIRNDIKQAMFENGPFPVCVFWNHTGGGGHCIIACKYDKDNVWFRNSWGSAKLEQWSWNDYEKWAMAAKYGSGCQYDVCIAHQLRMM